MKHGMFAKRISTQMAVTTALALALLLGPPCKNAFSETVEPSKLIVVEREQLYPDVAINPHQIMEAADGTLIVAGDRGVASVASFTSGGNQLWKYEEPADPKISVQHQSKFVGAVALENGTLLLCGEKSLFNPKNQRPQPHPLFTLLTSSGRLISSNLVYPHSDVLAWTLGFTKCVPSNGGALLFGRTQSTSLTSDTSLPWVVKVDQKGAPEWEKVGADSDIMKPPFVPPIATSGTTFFGPTRGFGDGDLHLIRVSGTGEVTATRDIKCPNYLLELHGILPTDNGAYLCAPADKRMNLIRVNNKLQDIVPPVELEDVTRGFFTAQLGQGFVLDDGSMIIFGRISTQKGDQAAMQLFSSSGHSLGFRMFDMNYHSFKADYVYPLGPQRFLTLRNSGPEQSGLVLSWVTIRRAP